MYKDKEIINGKQKKYIPENLDLDLILAEHPPVFKYKKDHFIHILNLLTEIAAYDKRLIENQRFVPINKQKLQSHIHNYKDYLTYLQEMGIIESDKQYIVGEKSISFRFTEKYQTTNKEVLVEKSSYNHSYQKSKKVDSRHLYPKLAKFFDDGLNIDVQAAKNCVRMKLEQDIADNDEKAFGRYNAAMLNICRLSDHKFYFHVDETSGRLHTNLTNLPKIVRNFITYEGKPLVSVDISNSQPFLSTLLMNQKFFEKIEVKSENLFNIFNIFPKLPSTHPTFYKFLPTIMLVFGEDSLRKQGNQDIAKYRQKASEGKLYEYMEEEIFKATGKRFMSRREIKNMIFSVLYSGNQFIGQPDAESKRLFRSLFPTVYEVFKLIKRHDKTFLPILLQSIEAKLILNNIAKRFCMEKRNVPIFTIHDSIVCQVGYEEYVKLLMQEEALKCVGIKPHLNPEYWKPENAIEGILRSKNELLLPELPKQPMIFSVAS